MTTTPQPDSHARERASESAPEVDAIAVRADRSVSGRAALRLVGETPKGSAAGADARLLSEARGPSRDATTARRLRTAPPVQLELISGRDGSGAQLVWASLPERSREQVLVLLARLIDAGAVPQDTH